MKNLNIHITSRFPKRRSMHKLISNCCSILGISSMPEMDSLRGQLFVSIYKDRDDTMIYFDLTYE